MNLLLLSAESPPTYMVPFTQVLYPSWIEVALELASITRNYKAIGIGDISHVRSPRCLHPAIRVGPQPNRSMAGTPLQTRAHFHSFSPPISGVSHTPFLSALTIRHPAFRSTKIQLSAHLKDPIRKLFALRSTKDPPLS